MKKTIISLLAILSMMFLASCQKEEFEQTPDQSQQQEVEISLSIQGEFDDFVPDTKSQAQTVSRICWAGGESVYAYVIVPTPQYDEDGYCGDKYVPTLVGTLTAAVEDGSDGRIATLSGTINRAQTDGRIFLLHSPLLSSAPTTTGSSLNISLATQGGTQIQFVAYAFVDYDSKSISNLKTKFTFATSVLYASVSGLRTDARSVWSASIVGINTMCTLYFGSSGYFSAGGSQEGTIKREWYYPNYPNEKGTMGIYFAIPESNRNVSRYLDIKQDVEPGMPNTLIGGKFATVALESGKTYLTHQACSNGVYMDGATKGQGIFVPKTGVWWAPVNCGYSSSNPKGMLYQWGRKFPFSDSTTPSYKTYQAASIAEGNDESNRAYFYKGNACWHSDSDTKNWQRAFDPCPAGWRVPTLDEFGVLFYSSWDRDTMTGYLNGSYSSGNWVFTYPVSYTLDGPSTSRSYSGTSLSYGYYWTATVNSTNGGYALSFNSTSESNQTKKSIFSREYQAYGYRVRCVQD